MQISISSKLSQNWLVSRQELLAHQDTRDLLTNNNWRKHKENMDQTKVLELKQEETYKKRAAS